MSDFTNKRRQNFLTENYYRSSVQQLEESIRLWQSTLPNVGDSPEEKKSLAMSIFASHSYEVFSLHYTAGVPCETLRDELGDVIVAFEQYQQALSIYEKEADTATFYLGEIDEYENLLQLTGSAKP